MRQQHFEEKNSKIQSRFQELKKSISCEFQVAAEALVEQLGIRERNARRVCCKA